MEADPLNWRVERACLNAWPSPRQLVIDNWLVRSAGGPTRRTNSANPLDANAAVDDGLIDRVETVYRRLDRPVLFRVPDMVSAIDDRLAARRYEVEGITRTLFGAADDLTLGDAAGVVVEPVPGEAWLSARDRLSGGDPASWSAYRAIIGSILLPCGFTSVAYEGRIAAIGFGAMQDGLLILESVITDPALRGLGLARRCVSGLISWACSQGAEGVALQVVAANAPARALYNGLGIRRDIYGYHYRVKA